MAFWAKAGPPPVFVWPTKLRMVFTFLSNGENRKKYFATCEKYMKFRFHRK